MKTLIIIMLIFGIAETISNLIHLSKGSKIKIGESAKKQHQELPLDIDARHFYYKAIIMFFIGILFMLSSSLFLFYDKNIGITFTLINSITMSLYGFVQLIIYYKTFKIWSAFVVYSIPLVAILLLI